VTSELHLLVNVAVAVAIALVGGLLAHALRQPVIVGYLLAGIVIGPFTPASSATASRSPPWPR
jgi:CPA2 family monovalent cation:H+ antiporter-2